jgi:hypothetical protein
MGSNPEACQPGQYEKGGRSRGWAFRAIRRELLGFRFDYPIEIIPGAGSLDSLHYYIASDYLFLDDLEFDENGVPMRNYRAHGPQYNPLFVTWWGLVNLERYLRLTDQKCLQNFFIQVEWLKAHAVHRDDGAVVWPCYFDWQEGFCRLKAPWISAMYQGMVISTLVRAYRVTGDKGLIALCEQGARVFEKSIEDGGVRTIEQGRVLYEEYPGYPLARVLDGFLISLLGLYDLAVETGRPDVRRLFEQGIQGLRQTLGYWDYRGKWSWYGARAYLCPPHYHRLNCVLLTVLGSLTGDTMLKRYAEQWDVRNLSVMDKVEIFLVFTIMKNWARVRLPRH